MKKFKRKKGYVYNLDIWGILATIIVGIIGLYMYTERQDSQLCPKALADVKEFVHENKEKKGSYLLQTEEYSFVLITGGKVADKKTFNISIDTPVFNKDKTAMTIAYQLIPFEASDKQKDNKPNFMLLKFKKVDSVTTTETNENIVEKAKNN